MRSCSIVELANTLELEKAQDKSGLLAHRLMCADLVILKHMGPLNGGSVEHIREACGAAMGRECQPGPGGCRRSAKDRGLSGRPPG